MTDEQLRALIEAITSVQDLERWLVFTCFEGRDPKVFKFRTQEVAEMVVEELKNFGWRAFPMYDLNEEQKDVLQ